MLTEFVNTVHLKAFLIFFGFLVVARLFIYGYETYLLKLTSKTKTTLDDKLVKSMRRPMFIFLIFLGAYFGISVLGFDMENGIVNKVFISLISLTLAFLAVKVTDFFVNTWLKKLVERTEMKADDVILPLAHKLTSLLFFIIAIIFILNIWGVEVGPLVASLGIAGLAVGFALKDTLANIFGGISLIADRTFKIGDLIQLDKETKGKIFDIGLRTTKIRTFDNEVIIIPNGDLSNKQVINFAKPDLSTRIALRINVAYGSNIDKVKKVLLKCVKVVDKEILNEDKEPKVYFTNMGDYALEFLFIVPVTDYTKRFVNEEKLRVEVYNALKKNKIDIPFPTYRIKR